MAKRYDPVLGRWIHGLPDDEPIRVQWDDIGYTTVDETHEFGSSYYTSPQARARNARVFFTTTAEQQRPDTCRICWAKRGECTHTGWDGVRDDEPIRIPPAERAGPTMIGDGVLRATVSGYSWMAVKRKLAAVDDALLQLAKLHAPSLEEQNGKLVRPECQGCFDTSGCREEWPCESATILLRRIGLTEHDLDYQLGDEHDGEAAGGV